VYHRVGKQLLWFANELRDCSENENIWAWMLRMSTVAALIVAAEHGRGLMEELRVAEPKTLWSMAVLGLGIIFPPVGTALLSIRAMYAFDPRRQIYERTRRLLHRHFAKMKVLLRQARSQPLVRPMIEIDFEFRLEVLRVEQTLFFELEEWLLVMNRSQNEIAP
jgi:hypothetical protein